MSTPCIGCKHIWSGSEECRECTRKVIRAREDEWEKRMTSIWHNYGRGSQGNELHRLLNHIH